MKKLPILVLLFGCKTMGEAPEYSAWIPFDENQGTIQFQCWINGVPARGMLDTGSNATLISGEFADENRITIGGRNAVVLDGGKERISTAKEFRVSFSADGEGAPIDDALIVRRDMGADVILGLFFFQNVVLQIDYPGSSFRYMTRAASTLQQQANTNVRIGESFHLMAEVEVHGSKQWLIVDTGASGSIYLPRRTAEVGGWLAHAKPKATASSLDESSDVEVMVLDAMKIGPYELTEIPLIVENKNDATPGLLGYDVLRHFVVTVDLDLGLLHLFNPGA